MIKWVKECAEEVFNEMGSGHTEAVYEAAMAAELIFIRPYDYEPISITRQVPCPLVYKGITVGVGFIDILIRDSLIVELKSVAKLTPKDVQQVRKYLIALDLVSGLLINFGNDLEIIEVHKQIPGIIEVPFPVDPVALKEAWEKGDHEQTPSSED